MADPTNLNEDTELVPGLKYAKSRDPKTPKPPKILEANNLKIKLKFYSYNIRDAS